MRNWVGRAVVLFSLAISADLSAATLYWENGSGTWDTTTSNWRTSPGGPTAVWTNGSDAVFLTTAGTVTVSSGISANSLAFNISGFTLQGTNALTLGAGGVDVAAGATATVNSPITGATGLTKSNTGILILAGTNTYTGATNVNAGTLRIAPATTGLVAYYPFEGTMNDASGRGHDGIYSTNKAASYGSGKFGQALSLNAIPGDYVSVAYAPDMALNTFTVSAWVNLNVIPGNFGGGGFGILGTRIGAAPNACFDLGVQNGTNAGTQFAAVHSDIGNGSGFLDTLADITNTTAWGPWSQISTASQWHMVTYVVNNTTQNTKMYIDGVLLRTKTFAGLPLFMTPTSLLGIGQTANTEWMNGRIDDVAIYNTALTDPQVAALLNGVGNATPIPPSSPLNIASGAVLEVNNNGVTVGSLSGGGNISLGTGTLTFGALGTNTTYSGVISSAAGTTGGISKYGTGTTIFTSNQTYTSRTLIMGGALQLGNSGTTGFLTGTSNVINHGTLIFNLTTPFSLANASGATSIGTITGLGSLVFNGNTTVTVTATTNTFVGTTTVNAGTINLASTTAGLGAATSVATFNAGSTFTSTGTTGAISSLVVMASGSTLSPGTALGQAKLTTGFLTLQPGSNVNLDLATPDVNGVNNTGGDDELAGVGVLTLGGTLNINPQAGFGPGAYRLCTNTPASLNAAVGIHGEFSAINGPAGFTYVIDTGSTVGATKLIVSANPTTANTLYWDPDGNSGNNDYLTGAGLGGTGAWDAPDMWVDNTGTRPSPAWNNANNSIAMILGAPGTITLGTATTANRVIFGSDGNILTGSTLALNAGIVDVPAGAIGTAINSTLVAPVAATFGTPGLTKNGTGKLLLGATANTYTGTTRINAGSLTLTSATGNGLPAATYLFLANGTSFELGNLNRTVASLSGSGNVTLGTGTLTVNGTIGGSYFGVISGAGGFSKTGTGTMLLGGVNTYLGATIGYGMIRLVGGPNRLPPTTTLSLGTGPVTQGILDLNNQDQTLAGITSPGTIPNSLVIDSTNDAVVPTLTLNITTPSTVGTTLFVFGALNQAGFAVTKTGPATLTLSNATGLYTGGFNINQGTVILGAANPLPNNCPINIAAGATLDMGTFTDTCGSLTGAGTVLLQNSILNIGSESSNQIFSGTITSSTTNGRIIKVGGGRQILSGTVTYTGITTISGGTLQFGNGGATGFLSAATPNSIQFSTSGGALSINVSSNNTFANTITGTGAVSLDGTGTLTLSNGAISLTMGGINVNAGKLNLTGNLQSATNIITIANGAAIGGSGTDAGPVVVNSGGTYAPGNGGGGRLTTGALTLSPGSASSYELNVPDNGAVNSGDDEGQVNGNLALAGNLNITNLGGMTTGTYRLFGYTGALTGSFGSISPVGSLILGIDTSTAGVVRLNVTQPPGSHMYWAGGSANWDTSSAQWIPGDVTGPFAVPAQAWNNANNDIAVFDTAAATVTVTTPILTNNLLFRQSGFTLTGAGPLLISTGSIDVPNSNVSINCPINGFQGITKTGAGDLSLGGANVYTGTTTVSGGNINVTSGSNVIPNASGVSLASGRKLVLNDNTETIGALGGAGIVDMGVLASTTLTVNSTVDSTFTGTVIGAGNVIKAGNGMLTLGGVSTYGGTTAINSGTIQLLAGSNRLPPATALTLGAVALGGQLDLNNQDQALAGLTTSGTGVNRVVNSATSGPLPTLTVSIASGETIYGGILGDVNKNGFNLTKTGSGTLTLSGNNIYSGGTNINQGALKVGDTLPGLTAWYPFDNTLVDASGKLHNGSWFNSATPGTAVYGAGKFGQAIDLSKASLQHIRVPFAADLGMNTFTLTGWIKLKSVPQNFGGGGYGLMGTRLLNGGGEFTLDLGVQSGATHSDVGNGVATWMDTLADINPTTVFGAVDGQFHMVTYVYDNAAQNTRMYIDGVLLRTKAFATAGTPLFMKTGQTLGIGQTANTEWMDGLIDDVAIFNTALNDVQVASLLGGVANGALPDSTLVTVAAGATLDLNSKVERVGALTGASGANVTLGSGTLSFGDASDHVFAGVISGTGGIAKLGAGAATFTADQTYTGATTIAAGTLRSGNGGAGSIATSSGIADNAVLTIDLGASNMTYANVISGIGSLTWNGSGTLTLNGNNTVTGSATINGGTLSGIGTWPGPVTLANGTTFRPGNGAGGKFTAGALALSATSTTNFRLNTPDTGLPGSGADDETQVNGNVTLNGSLSLTALGGFGVGTYRLFTYTGSLSGAYSTITGPAGLIYEVDSNTSGIVNLLVTKAPGATVYWENGTGSWDTTTMNWKTVPGGAADTIWDNNQNYVAVINTLSGTITLSGAITADNVVFRSNGYTVNGSTLTLTAGAISVSPSATATVNSVLAGQRGLNKNDAGALQLSGIETYASVTRVNGGILRLTGAGVVPDASSLFVGSGTTFDLNGNSETVGPLSGTGAVVLGTGTLTVNSTQNSAFGGTINGTGGLTKSGTATLTLGNSNGYTGTTAIENGTLQLSAGTNILPATASVVLGTASTPGILDLNNCNQTIAALTNSPTSGNRVIDSTNDATVPVLTINIAAGENIFSGSLGAAPSNGFHLTKTGNGTLTLSGGNAYSGATNINAGTLKIGVNSTGLIAYYPFDSALSDATGKGHNGAWFNSGTAGTAIYGAGKFGQAIDLSKASLQHIRVPFAADLGMNTFTLSGWIRLKSLPLNFGGGGYGLMGTRLLNGGGENTLDLGVQSGAIHSDFGTGTVWIDTLADINPTSVFGSIDGQFHMVTYVYDNAAQNVRMYIDGVLLRTKAFPVAGTPLFMKAGQTLGIGQTANTEWMDGFIDDVAIFNRALSNAEVAALLNGLSTGTPIPDASTVTIAGGATLDLNGATETIGPITGAGSVSLNGGKMVVNEITDSVYTGVISGTGTVQKTAAGMLTLGGANTYSGPTLVDSGTVQLSGGNDRLPAATALTLGTASSSAILDLNNQSQTVAGVAVGGFGINRVVDSTNDATLPTFTVSVASGTATLAAALGDTGRNGFHFAKSGNGTLVMTQGHIYTGTTAVNAGTLRLVGSTPLVAYYPFDSSLVDSTGKGHDGAWFNNTVPGTATYGTGRFGSAIDLSKASLQHIRVAHATDLQMNTFTLSGWIKIKSIPGSTGGTGYGLMGTRLLNAGGDFTLDLGVQSGATHSDVGNGVVTWMDTGADINPTSVFGSVDGQFHMLTYVYDNAAQNTRMYIDGVLLRTKAFATAGTPLFMKAGQTLGIGQTANTEWMDGFIDDVRIYNTALSDANVAALLTNSLGFSVDVIPDGSAVTVAGGATLDTGGNSETIGSLAGGGNVSLGGGGLVAGGDNSSTTYGGVMSGSGSFSKLGSGAMILTANQTYTGATTIGGGVLQAGNGGAGGSIATSSSIADNASLVINTTTNFTFAGVISGTGSLTNNAANTVTLSAANTYAGGTTFNAGTLRVTNTTGSATGPALVQMNSGSTLAGNGTITGNVALAAGATYAPTASGGDGTLTTGPLTFNATSISHFDLDAPGSASDDEGVVTGVLNLGGPLNVSNIGGMAYGTYRLFNCTGTPTGNFSALNMPPGFGATVSIVPGQVNLVVNQAPVLATPDQTATEFGAVTFAIVASDDPLETLTYALDAGAPPTAGPPPTATISGNMVTVNVADGPAVIDIPVLVSDNGNPPLSSTQIVQVNVTNVNPTAALGNGGSVPENSTGSVSFSNQQDISPVDVAATFHYSYDFDNDGTFDSGGNSYASALTSATETVPAIYFPDGPGTRTVRARIWDKDGGFNDYTTIISITNINPTATLNNSGNVTEGTLTASVAFTSPADASAVDFAAGLHYAYDLDNNGFFDVGGNDYLSSVTATSTTIPQAFLDDGESDLVVRARVYDKDNGFTEYFSTIHISNVAPIALMSAIGDTTEGGTTTFFLSAQVEPSNADAIAGLRYSYDFNYAGGVPSFDLGGTSYATAELSSNPTIPANQTINGPSTQTVLARIWDKDDGFTDYTGTFNITNVAPALSNLNAVTITENGTTTLTGTISDPGVADTFTLIIEWNDGAIDSFDVGAASGSQTFSFQHKYLDDDPTGTLFDDYAVSVTVIDSDNGSDVATVLVRVNDANPVVTIPNGLAPHLLEHTTTGLITLATFTDAGTLDTHSVTIDWGDATPLDTGATLIEPAGATPGSILANHLYDDGPGIRTVTVTVTDDDGGIGSATFNIIVDNVAPTATFQRPDAGSPLPMTSVEFVNANDVSDADRAAGLLYSYDWDNDGTFEVSLTNVTSMAIPPQYLLSHPNHVVHGRITDKDGGHSDYLLQQPFFASRLIEVVFDLGAQSSYTLVATAQPAPNYSIEVVDLPDGIANLDAIGLSFDGVATISGIPTVGGLVTLHATASNAAGAETVDLIITIRRPVNSNNPQIISEATANPNPSIAGTPVEFSVVATDADGDVLSYFWDFGDGTNARGRVVTHVYNVAQKYVVVVSVSDGKNDNTFDQLNLVVAQGTENTFDVQQAKLSFDFRKPERSTLYITGFIPIPSGPIAGVTANVSIAGTTYAQAFQFDSKGNAGDTMSLFSVKTIQTGTGTSRAKFVFSLKSTNGLDPLNPSLFQKIGGIFPPTTPRTGETVPVPMVVTIGSQQTVTNTIPLVYKVVVNRSGKGQFKRK